MFRTLFSWANGSQRRESSHRKCETSTFRKRSLRLESLENRQLLSVSPVTNDVVFSSSSIISEQELQQVIGEDFTVAEVEPVSSNEATNADLWFQRPMTLESFIIFSQLIRSYSPRSGLFANVDIGIAVQERSWGTGNWSAVEDGNLLWAQNEYRLTPSISNMPTGYGVYSSSFSYRTYNAQGNAGSWQTLTQEPYYSAAYPFISNSAFIDDGSSAMGLLDFRMTVVFADYATGNPVYDTTYITTAPYFRSSLNVSWSAVDGSTNAIQLGENPAANGGGQRCFPEKASPTGDVNDAINVQVSVSRAIPEGYSGDVWLRLFDPDNALGLDQNDTSDQTHTPVDNYGNAHLYGSINSLPIKINVSSSQSTWSISMTILDAHAGDNYIVASHPDEDGILQYRLNPINGVTVGRPSGNPDDPDSTYTYENVVKTEKLTVWRTLNVECDVMSYYPGATNTGTVITPPNPSLYLDDFVASELARACVVTSVYTPNTHQPTVSHNPMTESELLQLFGDTFDSNHLPVPDPSATPITTGRDLAMDANSSDFWAVRIVMTSSDAADVAGCFLFEKNTILVYYDTMDFFIQYWNNTHSSHANLDANLRRIVLHEMGHALISAAEGQSGIMLQTNCIHDNTTLEELSFLNSEILDIQKFSRIR